VNEYYAGIGCWKKRRLGCNDQDTGLNITWRESEPTSSRSFIAREFRESQNEEKQMTATCSTGASSANAQWSSINWKETEAEVRRLQMRIAKAIRDKRFGKAKALQWLLTHSHSAKLLAIK
jgi:RNA-directed DNA polymerase